MWFIHLHILSWFRSNLMFKIIALCQGTFNFKGSNTFFFCVLFLKDSLFLISSWKTGAIRAACSSQDWDHEKGTCLDSFQWLPSVTFYLEVVYSVMPLLLRIWNAFWPFEDCYLLAFVFAQFFYCLKLPCMKIYKYAFLQIKHSYFTRDLGPLHPSSHQLQSPGPGLQRPRQAGWQFTSCPFALLSPLTWGLELEIW